MLVLSCCILVPLLLYVAINEVKFHTLFSLPLEKQAFSAASASRQAALAANGGSLFGVKFIPTALVQYLRPDALSFHRLFPWVGFPGAAAVVGNVRFDTLDWASSAPATMPVLVGTGLVGLFGAFRRGSRRPVGVEAVRAPLAGAAAGAAATLTIAYVANRYLADAFPLIAVASLAGVWMLRSWFGHGRRVVTAAGAIVIALLGLFGIWANLGLGLTYQRLVVATVPATTASFISFQEKVDSFLFGDPPTGVEFGSHLPDAGPINTLFVLNRCEGLYYSDGRSWNGLEGTNATDHFRVRLTFPDMVGIRRPLLTTGTPGSENILAVHFLGRSRVAFSYLFEGYGQPWYDGPTITVVPRRSYVVDAVIDPRVAETSVLLDGTKEFGLDHFVHPGTEATLGGAPAGSPVAQPFAGSLENLPVPTPICDSLARRYARADHS